MNHGALFFPGPEGEFFFITIDIEADFSSSNINLSSYSAQERSPKDKGCFICYVHVEHHKVDRDVAILDFYWNIFGYPCRVADRRIGQLKHHWCWRQLREVQPVEDGLGHNAYASPKVAQGLVEVLDPDGT